MESTDLELSYTITEADIADWCRFYTGRTKLLAFLTRFAVPAVPPLMYLAMVLWLPGRFSGRELVMLGAGALAWLVFSRKMLEKSLVNMTIRMPLAEGKTTGALGQHVMTVTDREIASGKREEPEKDYDRHRLAELHEVIETDRHIFIYVAEGRAMIVPKRDLSPVTLQALLMALRTTDRPATAGLGSASEQPPRPEPTRPQDAGNRRSPTITPPAGMRSRVSEEGGGLAIVIPHRKHWGALVAAAVMFYFWVEIEVFTIPRVLESMTGDVPFWITAILVVFVVGWTAGGLWSMFWLLWTVFGNETLQVSPGKLTVQQALFGLGPKRAYRHDWITRLRTCPNGLGDLAIDDAGSRRRRQRGGLTFDYDGTTVRLATGLADDEAAYVQSLLCRGMGLEAGDPETVKPQVAAARFGRCDREPLGRAAARTLAIIYLLSLAWRLIINPFSFGDVFAAAVLTAMFTAMSTAIRSRLLRLTYLSLGALLIWAAVFVSIAGVFPFVFLLLVVGIFATTRTKTSSWFAAVPVVLGGLVFVAVALAMMPRSIIHVRDQLIPVMLLSSDRVESIQLVQLDPEDRYGCTPLREGLVHEVTDRAAIRRLVAALHATSPYSPNHEGIREPWLLNARTSDGGDVSVVLGRSSASSRTIGWVEFRLAGEVVRGSFDYQNPRIRPALEELGFRLW